MSKAAHCCFTKEIDSTHNIGTTTTLPQSTITLKWQHQSQSWSFQFKYRGLVFIKHLYPQPQSRFFQFYVHIIKLIISPDFFSHEARFGTQWRVLSGIFWHHDLPGEEKLNKTIQNRQFSICGTIKNRFIWCSFLSQTGLISDLVVLVQQIY